MGKEESNLEKELMKTKKLLKEAEKKPYIGFDLIKELKKHIILEKDLQKAEYIECSLTGELIPFEIVEGKLKEFVKELKKVVLDHYGETNIDWTGCQNNPEILTNPISDKIDEVAGSVHDVISKDCVGVKNERKN